jgi:hypothetical protein
MCISLLEICEMQKKPQTIFNYNYEIVKTQGLLSFRKRQHTNKKKYTKMSRFNIYQQLQVIVDSFSFDFFPQFKFPTKQSLMIPML